MSYNRYPRFWFLRTLRVILREAGLGGRLLCAVGAHRWAARTEIDRERRLVKDYNRCVRPFCKYRHEMRVNEEPYPF